MTTAQSISTFPSEQTITTSQGLDPLIKQLEAAWPSKTEVDQNNAKNNLPSKKTSIWWFITGSVIGIVLIIILVLWFVKRDKLKSI